MTPVDMFAFAAIMFAVAVAPGPGVFTVTARALACGFTQGAITTLGIVAGDLSYLLLAIYGLAAIAAMLGEFFIIVQYAGGVYLLWLGFRIWTAQPEAQKAEGVAGSSWKTTFSSGLLVTLANPKAILFYLGFLPGFIDLQNLAHTDVLIIATIIGIVLGGVMLTYAYAAAQAGRLLGSRSTAHGINAVAGAIMLAGGVLMLVKAG